MSHRAAAAVSIMDAAAELGLVIEGRRACCFNAAAHQGGEDANPSLTFFPDHGRFKCYACGVRGDVIDLVKGVQGCDFTAAITWIEGLAKERPAPSKATITPGVRHDRTPYKQASEVYKYLFKHIYDIGTKTRGGKYLRRRQLDPNLVNEYGGAEIYNPDETWTILKDEFDLEQLRGAGLVSRKNNFLFARHRLLFFYFDDGWPVYVQARNIDDDSQPKELSLSGLQCPVPYNADLLHTPQKRVFLCEGCIDTLSALQMGLPAVGVPGVMGFRQDWFDLFRNVGHVVLVFDNDEAGKRQAAELRAQFRLRKIMADACRPESVKDINDMLIQKKKGVSQ
jgi:DNA primase